MRECSLWDHSEGGAKLSPIKNSSFDLGAIPDDFYVYMSPDLDFLSRRRCHVAWRSKTHVGIQFQSEARKAGSSAAKEPEKPR